MATKGKVVKRKRKSPVTRTKKITKMVDEATALNMKFREVWQRLSEKGLCDSIDGVEYQRVIHEWVDGGTTENIAQFIRQRANVPLPLQQ